MSVDTSNAAAGVDASRSQLAGAIKQAANITGTNFEYLLATAKLESDFNPSAGASTSSAHGLYQFIEQTWLGTVKEAGGQLGYGNYADAITRSPLGGYSVADPATRTAILKLRDDPAIASALAGVFTQSNSFKLTGLIGRRPTDAELYIAHFLGVNGAGKLISNAEDNPQASGERLFPNAAAANRSIFYDRTGRARSISEVYSALTERYASAVASAATQTALASAGVTPKSATLASAAPPAQAIDNAAYLSSFPYARSPSSATAASASGATDASPPTDPIFRSLFQGGERTQPISPTVQRLWGNSSSLTSVAAATPAGTGASTPNVGAPQGLDLFSDRSGNFSG
jgi:hypothetical protein